MADAYAENHILVVGSGPDNKGQVYLVTPDGTYEMNPLLHEGLCFLEKGDVVDENTPTKPLEKVEEEYVPCDNGLYLIVASIHTSFFPPEKKQRRRIEESPPPSPKRIKIEEEEVEFLGVTEAHTEAVKPEEEIVDLANV